jgi:cytochrome P450
MMLQRPLFDPTAPGFLKDPYPFYARLREAEPWHLSPLGFYVVSRFEDVNFVMRDKRFGQNWIGPKLNNADPKLLQKAIFRSIAQWMLKRDPPDHTRLRSCFSQAFTARRVDAMRAHIEAIAEKIVEDIRPRGQMDAVAEFALAIPLISITDILGVPQEDRDLMFRVSRFVGRLSDPVPFDPDEIDRVDKDFGMVADYFERLIEERRRQPGHDLVSQIVAAAEQERLSTEEMIGNLVLVFVAGHETTTNLIGNALLALDRHPDQLRLLQQDPSLMPKAVTEFLRYDTSVQAASRVALEDIEIGDVKLAKGRAVVALFGAANRDPKEFSNPDALDIRRPETSLASFGGGIHYCLGAQLSRIEVECALKALFRQIPDFHLVDSAAVARHPSIVLRGPANLPAAWSVK